MADEVYRKVGRGGAGNYYSKKDVEHVQKSALTDIETQLPLSRTSSHDSATRAAAAPPSGYLHTGRGGAGNWIQPSDLTSSGLAQTSDPIPTSTNPSHTINTSTTRVAGASKPSYRGGRGGAGNYRDFEEEEKARREEEERKRAEMEKQVTKDVERGLQRPGKAYGAPEGKGGVFEMRDMS